MSPRPTLVHQTLMLIVLLTAACAAPDDGRGAGVSPSGAIASGAIASHAGSHAAAGGDPVDDPVAYLGQLGLVRGHLFVGLELFRRGDLEGARSHMKHPSDELYAGLVPAFAARGLPGFASELEHLATLVERERDQADIEVAYTALVIAIAAHEAGIRTAPGWTPALDLQVAAFLVRTAGDEYDEGVTDGRVVEPHEYQDAYGFVQIARALVDGLDAEPRAQQAVAQARGALDSLEGAWPDLPVPAGPVTVTAATFAEAAARLERAAAALP